MTSRRTSAGSGLVVISTVIAALSGCSGGDAGPALAITRKDGTRVETDRTLRAWCGVPHSQGDAGQSLHVLEGERAFANSDDVPSYWIFRAELEKLGQTTRFAVGSIEVERWGCDEGDAVTLTVNARVASEIGGDSFQVHGTVTTEIANEPEGYAG